MDIESQLRRRENPRPVPSRGGTVLGVRRIYLEDIKLAYDTIVEIQQGAVNDQIQAVNELAKLVGGEVVDKPRNAQTLKLISMYNEEYEFDHLEQIASLRRTGFSEFYIRGESPECVFEARRGRISFRVHESEDTSSQISNVLERLKTRQPLLIRVLTWKHPIPTTVIVIALFVLAIWILSNLESSIGFEYLQRFNTPLTWLAIFGFLLVGTMWYLSVAYRYIVVPKYQVDAGESFMAKHGVAIVLNLLIMATTIIGAIIGSGG